MRWWEVVWQSDTLGGVRKDRVEAEKWEINDDGGLTFSCRNLGFVAVYAEGVWKRVVEVSEKPKPAKKAKGRKR